MFMLLVFTVMQSDTTLGPFYLDEVIVTASRFEESWFTAPFSIDIIEVQDDNWTDLLFAYPGVFLRDYSNLTLMSKRGMSSEENLIVIDGLPVNSPLSGTIDLTLIPLSFIDKIEIRSGGSSLFGSGGLGGVSALPFLKKGGRSTAEFAIGSFGKREAMLFNRLGFKRFTVNLGIDLCRSDGDFPYRNSFGDVFKRRNNWLRRSSCLTKLIGTCFEISTFLSSLKCGAPGPVGSPKNSERNENFGLLKIAFESNLATFTAFLTFDNMAYITDSTQKDINNGLICGLSAVKKGVLDLRAGLLWKEGYSTHTGRKNKLEINASCGAKTELGKLILSSETRLRFLEDLKPVLTYFIGVGSRISENIFTFLSLSQNYRDPTFNELYWRGDPLAVGNPNLKPETGRLTEAGLRCARGKFFVDVTGYAGSVRNMIVWEPDTHGKWSPQNRKSVQLKGVECRTGGEFGIIKVLFGGSFNSITSNGRQLFMRPQTSATAEISVKNVFFRMSYIGERYERPSGPKKMPSVLTLDCGAKFNFCWKGIKTTFTFKVRNLTDVSYELVRGYPLPGRHFEAKLRMDIL